jgi:ferredoxin
VAVRVTVDSVKCQGHQVCGAMMPGVFGCDELGYAVVLGDGRVQPTEDLDLVVHNCPEQAISVLPE